MSNSKRVKIQLTADSHSMSLYSSQLMAEVTKEFFAAPDPKPGDYLAFDFTFKDKNGVVHTLNPYYVRRDQIRATPTPSFKENGNES